MLQRFTIRGAILHLILKHELCLVEAFNFQLTLTQISKKSIFCSEFILKWSFESRQLLIQALDLVTQALYVFVELELAKIEIENVLAAVTSWDHTLFELNSVQGDNISAVCFPLESYSAIKISADYLVSHKVVDSSLNLPIVPSSHINHVRDELSSKVLQLLGADLIFAPLELLWNVFQDHDVFHEAFLFQELCDVFWGLRCVNDQEFQAFGQAHLYRNVVLSVDRFDQLIELSKVASASLLELIQDLHQPCVLRPELFVHLDLFELKLFL